MLNYNEEVVIDSLPLRIKNSFVEGITNKYFLENLIMLLLKTLMLLILISDDKVNGVNFKLIFYSMPPILVWVMVNSAFLSLGFFFKGSAQKWSFLGINLFFTTYSNR